jgi:hypothetical protein
VPAAVDPPVLPVAAFAATVTEVRASTPSARAALRTFFEINVFLFMGEKIGLEFGWNSLKPLVFAEN